MGFHLVVSQDIKNDSLLTVARNIKNDSIKLSLYNIVAFNYIFNDLNKALEIIQESEQLAKSKSLYYNLAELTNTHGVYMDIKGNSDSAKFYFDKALELSRKYNFLKVESRAINNLGMFNWNKSNFEESLNYFFQSLSMDESRGDIKSTSRPLNNIGLIYQEMSLFGKALEYHQRALKIREEYGLKKDQVASLNNIGICYKNLGKLDEAIKAYEQGIDLAKATDNYFDYYKLLDNLANVYQIKEDFPKAIQTYLRALERIDNFNINEKGLLSTYSNLTSVYNKVDNPKKALEYAEKAFNILNRNTNYSDYSDELYLYAAESYYMLNNFREARNLTEKYIKVRDSFFSKENANAIADLEVKYDTEKKEKQILVQRAELAENGLTIQKRNTQLLGLIALAIVFILVGYLLYNQQKLKNKQLQKENELKDALVKIEMQNKLQEQRLRISRDLHDNIGAQLTFIISSIDNLKYHFDYMDDKLNLKLNKISSFTLSTIYELRDTIWAMNKNEITFEDLKVRTSNFIEKAHLSAYKTTFNFEVDAGLENSKKFTSLEGMNIYRIIQEAVNNAIKYANAKHINVTFQKSLDIMLINIKDDGIGFDIEKTEFGNGLNNIQKRAKDINAQVEINSSPNEGTEILLKQPLN